MIDSGIPAALDLGAVADRYRALERDVESPANDAWLVALREWDALRRELKTWSALTQLRFDQNTNDDAARAARVARDEVAPKLTAFETAMKRRYVGGPQRSALVGNFGEHIGRLWENDLATFDPVIEPDLVRESELCAQYTALIAGIEVDFRGERLNLSALARYGSDSDRNVRYEATAARWRALGAHAAELDRIYDDLVHLRTKMARTLGCANFTELGYRRMRRIDYGRADVERYRDAVVRHVVPIANALVRRTSSRLGLNRISVWDEVLVAAESSPKPRGDERWIVDRTIESFEEMDPQLGAFVRMMSESQLTDLVTRPGKAGGGYCTMLPTHGVPFVFTNFNGTKGDVTVLMHELGHAFQGYSSRALPIVDYLSPTLESAEIHSMALEYLTWPHMERFFGDEADTYRRAHLAQAMLFLPYGVAVDHFQHLVYEQPDATAAERHAMWRSMEERYLPWRCYGDLERPNGGAFWQSQLHIYRLPFYYIDYTLALCCALQFWASAFDDRDDALARYVTLCARGGEAAFQDLVTSAGLTSPFEPDALRNVVARAKAVLEL